MYRVLYAIYYPDFYSVLSLYPITKQSAKCDPSSIKASAIVCLFLQVISLDQHDGADTPQLSAIALYDFEADSDLELPLRKVSERQCYYTWVNIFLSLSLCKQIKSLATTFLKWLFSNNRKICTANLPNMICVLNFLPYIELFILIVILVNTAPSESTLSAIT